MMNRKLTAVLLAASMIAGSCVPVMADPARQASAGTVPAESASAGTSADVMTGGYIPIESPMKNAASRDASENLLGDSSLPAAYDLRDEGFNLPIKNQEQTMNCWTFATIASAESSIVKKGYDTAPSLSELQMGWYVYHRNADTQPAGCEKDTVSLNDGYAYGSFGGTYFFSTASLMERRGYAAEATAPYKNVQTPGFNDQEMAYNSDAYVLSDVDLIGQGETEKMKKELMEKGAMGIMVAFFDEEGKDYYQNDNDALYDPNQNEMNHGVTLIGWDDNYSRTNFNEGMQPEHDGAWIFRNSYGDFGNHGGYGYLSYEDGSNYSVSSLAASFQAVPKSEAQDNVYQYDGAIKYGFDTAPEGSSCANVFTARGNESLNAVQFFAISSQEEYRVSIYTDVKDTPTSGKSESAATTEGVIENAGYHTVDLASAVQLKAGTKFSVVVQFLGDNVSKQSGMVYLTYESALSEQELVTLPGLKTEFYAAQGESYCCTDGSTWTDHADTGNFCVKALTDNLSTEITTKKVIAGNAGDLSGISFDATGAKKTRWSSSGRIPDGLKLNADTGMLVGTFEKAGIYTFTITAVNATGTDEKSYTVQVGIQRLSGESRYETMRAVDAASFPGGCETAVIASAENWPDALAASALAGSAGGAVVLTSPEYLSQNAEKTIKALGVSKVIVVGGTGAVSGEEDVSLNNMGFTGSKFLRLAGADRTETAELIAGQVMKNSTSDTCIVAAGSTFADALSISGYAYEKKTPILLTQADGTLSESTLEIVKKFKNAIIVGGESAVSSTVEQQLNGFVSVSRYGGEDRYETSALIIQKLYGNAAESLVIATGEDYPDALVGSSLGRNSRGAVLLVNGSGDSLSSDQKQIIGNTGTGWVIGGEGAVPENLKKEIDTAFLS